MISAAAEQSEWVIAEVETMLAAGMMSSNQQEARQLPVSQAGLSLQRMSDDELMTTCHCLFYLML